MVKYFVLN